jgi:hypothetical protein
MSSIAMARVVVAAKSVTIFSSPLARGHSKKIYTNAAAGLLAYIRIRYLQRSYSINAVAN